ncbi:thermosome subunit [Methanoplanus sp. FWC-SCC4]|uniref:Thermosome subunit n=1 Tax=Methanochimaera problematica TaxID=2609417 RepID=A0AA97FEU3_9EURY|nr:thermosome subunit alpha [Methanoplanus sp. FWC-SCC4]WOF16983.1 thermosome subunit [Methanoplanus sp. FWC-SCC4]
MLAGQQVVILRDNVDVTSGMEAQHSNIMACKAIASAVRTTLGPRGMDKMLVSPSGDVVITNDGATILHELSVEHPAAKMVISVAEAQDDEVGDGTTTASILIGALMEEAEILLKKGIHPTIIAKGYTLGMEKAMEILNANVIEAAADDREMLLKVAGTAVTGKSIESMKEKITGIIVDAVLAVAQKAEDGTYTVDEDDVRIKTVVGDSMDDAELITGFLIDKTRCDQGMPKKVENAKIALLSMPLEVKKTETKAKIKITSSEQVEAFSEKEKESLKTMAEAIKASGANVVLCQKGIADAVQYFLSHDGILAIQDVPEKDMKAFARALDGTIVNAVADLEESVLGNADLIEEMKDIAATKFTGCKNGSTVSILIKGSNQIFVDELERAVYDSARVVMDALEDGKFVVGGAAIDTELYLSIRDYASTMGGRIQLAIEAFANIFETIPATLAENSGHDPIDILVDLKSAHANGSKYAGLNVYTGKVSDMYEAGVIEPMRVKRQAVQSASETACLLIRVDDMMVSKSAAQMAR